MFPKVAERLKWDNASWVPGPGCALHVLLLGPTPAALYALDRVFSMSLASLETKDLSTLQDSPQSKVSSGQCLVSQEPPLLCSVFRERQRA